MFSTGGVYFNTAEYTELLIISLLMALRYLNETAIIQRGKGEGLLYTLSTSGTFLEQIMYV